MSESELKEKPNKQRQIAEKIEDLPPIPEDSIRVVHITTPQNAIIVLNSGLDYAKYGMASSTARAYSKPEDVEFGSDDPRFNYPGLKVIVLDMSNAEWKQHNEVTRASGLIPKERIVGIVDNVITPRK